MDAGGGRSHFGAMTQSANQVPVRVSDEPGPIALLRPYVEALLMVAGAVLVGQLLASRWSNSPVDLLFIPPVLAAATLYGIRPALFAALASALSFNYFFTQPIHSFRIDRPSDVMTVVVLFIVAAVTSQLAARVRDQAQRADANAARNATIAGLARRLLSGRTEAEIGEVAVQEIACVFDCNAALLSGLPDPQPIAQAPGHATLTLSDTAAALSALTDGEPAGRGTNRIDPADWLFFPVRTEEGVVAAMGLARDDGTKPLTEEQKPLLVNLLDQVALALARVRLEGERQDLEGLRERDRLRGALLSSVGHDLRTPLTAIIGAAGELRRDRDADPLVGTIAGEAAKLERYISNLLDMARIEAGAVRLREEAVDLVDAVGAALRDLQPTMDGRGIGIQLDPELPLVRLDPQLLHHIIINLVDNALRHSPGDGAIDIRGEAVDGGVELAVANATVDGDAPDLDAFRDISGSDTRGGTGLGLAIVKGFAEAMGGSVAIARDAAIGGVKVAIRFGPELTVKG